jgi:hypothetical protein
MLRVTLATPKSRFSDVPPPRGEHAQAAELSGAIALTPQSGGTWARRGAKMAARHQRGKIATRR